MKLIYSHPNPIMVGSMRSALNALGIETEIRNDLLGGATGELAPDQTWVELWAINEAQALTASKRLKEIIERPERANWICNFCRERNPATFEVCWRCQTPD